MDHPNILLLFSDEHSFRFMGHVPEEDGGEPIQTPAFDALAQAGTVFTDMYCQMPLCTPSRISMLCGREVRGCGAWRNESVLRPELHTMPGVFRHSGYTTCLVGKMHLGGTQQFAGFQYRPYGDLSGRCGHQGEPLPAPEKGMRDRTAAAVGTTQIPESRIQDKVVAHETIAFLREHYNSDPDKPWFLCAGFSRPHFPLTSPKRHIDRFWPHGVTEPKVPASGDAYDHAMSLGMRKGFQADKIDHDEMMYARACYFANVSFLDEVIGDMLLQLDSSGLLENTIIIYTTDHGEMAGEHGVWWKNGWYEACTRVPFILSMPGHRTGKLQSSKCRTPVGLVDLFPTLCSLAGVEAPDGLDGADLSSAILNREEAPDRPIFCDVLIPRWGQGMEFRMVRQAQYKYVRFRNAPPLAFNLETDPGEQKNLLSNAVPGSLPEQVKKLAEIADSTMDFDEAEREMNERDGTLKQDYTQDLPESTGNLFLMPSGALINADDTLYSPAVIAEPGSLEKAFGKKWKQQNSP